MERPHVQERWTEETHVGPSSEQIFCKNVIREATAAGLHPSPRRLEASLRQKWLEDVPAEVRVSILDQCCVSDLCQDVQSAFIDPSKREAVLRYNHETLMALVEEEKPAFDREIMDWIRRARNAHATNNNAIEDEEAEDLYQRLQGNPLRCSSVHDDAHVYIKRLGNDCVNGMNAVKYHSMPPDLTIAGVEPADSDVVITLTVYTPNTTRYLPLRIGSQHVFLGSHTLGDLVDIFPCPSNDIPLEVLDEDGYIVNYDAATKMDAGCVIAMEQPWLHGDGMSDVDYADRYLALMAQHPEAPQNLRKGADLYDTPFSSTPLRINYPYFMLHQGNCQHYIVIDQIRLRHPSDPPIEKFPCTIHHAPASGVRSKCRICVKLPATLSVVGDVRLGESPCLVCSECWELMGEPAEDEDTQGVFVIPLLAGEVL